MIWVIEAASNKATGERIMGRREDNGRNDAQEGAVYLRYGISACLHEEIGKKVVVDFLALVCAHYLTRARPEYR